MFNTNTVPMFYWMMSDADKYQYNCLRYSIATTASKNQRNKRISTFNEAMDAIKMFAIRGDANDKLRSLVCGICWLNEGIAINTHQLKTLLGKCKSSINGSLQKIGFSSNLSRAETTNAMTRFFPFLNENSSELRKWSVRNYPQQVLELSSPPQVPHAEEPVQKEVAIAVQSVQNELPMPPIEVEPLMDCFYEPEINDWQFEDFV